MIEIRCPRCDTHYHVPADKAGKKGRCPKCGGAIRVPEPDHQVHAQYVPEQTFTPAQKRLMIMIPCAVLLLVGVIVFLQRGKSEQEKRKLEQLEDEARTGIRRTEQDLARVEDLAERFGRYSVKLNHERRMMARMVLQRDRSYEAVTPGEYRLRTEVLEERARAQATPATYKEEEWRVDAPLSEDEAAMLQRCVPELEREAKEIARLTTRAGGTNVMTKDAVGHDVVNGEEIRKQLSARIKSINERRAKAEADLREVLQRK